MSGLQWKMFFDIVCPNSWTSFKLLRSEKMKELTNVMEFVPICDVKLAIIRAGDWRKVRREHKILDADASDRPQLLGNVEFFQKRIPAMEGYVPPRNWQETYASAMANGSIVPALFLCSVKHRAPEYLLSSIEVVGRRLWEQRLPVHKGAHMSSCAREAGISFPTSEEIISRLSHVESKQLLGQNSEDALATGATTFAPLFVGSASGSAPIVLDNFKDFTEHCRSQHMQLETSG